MKDITKYQGVIPAFYACYDEKGEISTEGVKALTRHLISKGVKGVYVGGSSGECIYQHVDERKKVLEAVMEEAKGKLAAGAEIIYLGWLMAGTVKGYKPAVRRYRIRAVGAVGMAATGTNTDQVRKSNHLPEKIPVARYHSLSAVEEKLPDCLKITAKTEDGEIMAVRHKEYAVYGLQFHPESIMTPDGMTILR